MKRSTSVIGWDSPSGAWEETCTERELSTFLWPWRWKQGELIHRHRDTVTRTAVQTPELGCQSWSYLRGWAREWELAFAGSKEEHRVPFAASALEAATSCSGFGSGNEGCQWPFLQGCWSPTYQRKKGHWLATQGTWWNQSAPAHGSGTMFTAGAKEVIWMQFWSEGLCVHNPTQQHRSSTLNPPHSERAQCIHVPWVAHKHPEAPQP